MQCQASCRTPAKVSGRTIAIEINLFCGMVFCLAESKVCARIFILLRKIDNISKMRAMRKKKNTPHTRSAKKSAKSNKAPVKIHHFHFREIMGWSFVIVIAFGILSLLSSKPQSSRTAQTVQEKVSQASTLTVSGDEDSPILLAVGNIMLGRYIESTMRKLSDYTYPFLTVSAFLKSGDVAFASLGTPLVYGKTTSKDSFFFRADPEGAKGLSFAGFDVISLANNQMMNYGDAGLVQTMNELAQLGIRPVGAGKNIDGAHTPVVVQVKGKKIAFYSYDDPNLPPYRGDAATQTSAGVAIMDLTAVKNDVKNALSLADFVVVSMHAGSEYKKEPSQFQKDFAHAAIDAGASVVIGHHPHVIQPVEYYNNGVIFYSLGNFVFDQFFSDDVRTGLVAKIHFEKGQRPAVEFFPVRIDSAQPRILEGTEREQMLKKLGL